MKNTKKIIHNLKLDSNLHSLAFAVSIAKKNAVSHVSMARKKWENPEECPLEIQAHLFALFQLHGELHTMFWSQIDKKMPKKYTNNIQSVDVDEGKVIVFNEKEESIPEEEETDKGLSIDEMMQEAGVKDVDSFLDDMIGRA